MTHELSTFTSAGVSGQVLEKNTVQVTPCFQQFRWPGCSLALLHAGCSEFSFKLENPGCPVLRNRGLQVAVWELGAKKWDVTMFLITVMSALLLDVVSSSDFSIPQLNFCWLFEITCKRGERLLSLIEFTSVGEGAGGFNLDSSPRKSKRQQVWRVEQYPLWYPA